MDKNKKLLEIFNRVDGSEEIWNESKNDYEFSFRVMNLIISNGTDEMKSPLNIIEAVKKLGIICFNRSDFITPLDFVLSYIESNKKTKEAAHYCLCGKKLGGVDAKKCEDILCPIKI